MWVIQFDDGFVLRCGQRKLAKMLTKQKKNQLGKQLDYIFVSSRWKSCIRNCGPKWGPSKHRNIHGQKGDHALFACTWQWRLRTEKHTPVKDFDSLKHPMTLAEFESAVQLKLKKLRYDAATDTTTTMYNKICDAVSHAVETTIPTVTRKKGVIRKVSDRTKELFDRRTKMTGTKAQYKKLQKEIKESSLQDFKDWVSEWADAMQAVCDVGDVHRVYEG